MKKGIVMSVMAFTFSVSASFAQANKLTCAEYAAMGIEGREAWAAESHAKGWGIAGGGLAGVTAAAGAAVTAMGPGSLRVLGREGAIAFIVLTAAGSGFATYQTVKWIQGSIGDVVNLSDETIIYRENQSLGLTMGAMINSIQMLAREQNVEAGDRAQVAKLLASALHLKPQICEGDSAQKILDQVASEVVAQLKAGQ